MNRLLFVLLFLFSFSSFATQTPSSFEIKHIAHTLLDSPTYASEVECSINENSEVRTYKHIKSGLKTSKVTYLEVTDKQKIKKILQGVDPSTTDIPCDTYGSEGYELTTVTYSGKTSVIH
jgi:hypothetical protein